MQNQTWTALVHIWGSKGWEGKVGHYSDGLKPWW